MQKEIVNAVKLYFPLPILLNKSRLKVPCIAAGFNKLQTNKTCTSYFTLTLLENSKIGFGKMLLSQNNTLLEAYYHG